MVSSDEWIGFDLAVFTGEVTDLTCLGECRVAGWGLAADERVEVAEGGGAISVGGDGGCVDVVEEWPTACRQILEADLEVDADTVWGCYSGDRAFDIATRIGGVEELGGGKVSNVDHSWRVVLDDRRVASKTGDGLGGSLCGDDRGEDSQEDGEDTEEIHLEVGIRGVRLMIWLFRTTRKYERDAELKEEGWGPF